MPKMRAMIVPEAGGKFELVERDLPAPDRIAHLLLALRCDERDFATVANLAFSGAPWRLRRRLPAGQREALAAALTASGR